MNEHTIIVQVISSDPAPLFLYNASGLSCNTGAHFFEVPLKTENKFDCASSFYSVPSPGSVRLRPAPAHHSSGISSRRARLRTICCMLIQSSSPACVVFPDVAGLSWLCLVRSDGCSSSELPTDRCPTQA